MGEIPLDELVKWMHPRDALERVSEKLGSVAASTIYRRLKDELIIAAAAKVSARAWGITTNVIPARYWERRRRLPGHVEFWKSGDIEFDLGSVSAPGRVTYYGVRFRPDGIDDILGISNAASGAPPPTANTAQRPQRQEIAGGRGAHWENLLIEMARRIHFGDFKPAKQADLERAMQDWLSKNDHEADESTVRIRASKLWKALMAEG